jgi:outer membrane protein OmpA-like peptidoglycan-associated protein
MRTLIIGAIIFLGWGIFSNYWYVCKVKGLCSHVQAMHVEEATLYADTLDTPMNGPGPLTHNVVYFEFDTTLIVNKAIFNSINQQIQNMQFQKVILEGHCCDLGTESYNKGLGKRRAEKISEAFVANGIEKSAISMVSHGESQPAVPNTSEENREKNRRVEIIIK